MRQLPDEDLHVLRFAGKEEDDTCHNSHVKRSAYHLSIGPLGHLLILQKMYSLAQQIRWNISKTETVLAKKIDNDDDDDLLEANIQITLQDPRVILDVEVHCFPPTSSQHLFLIDALLKSCDALVFMLRLFIQQRDSSHYFQKNKMTSYCHQYIAGRHKYIKANTNILKLMKGVQIIVCVINPGNEMANKPSQEKFMCRHQPMAGRLEMN